MLGQSKRASQSQAVTMILVYVYVFIWATSSHAPGGVWQGSGELSMVPGLKDIGCMQGMHHHLNTVCGGGGACLRSLLSTQMPNLVPPRAVKVAQLRAKILDVLMSK